MFAVDVTLAFKVGHLLGQSLCFHAASDPIEVLILEVKLLVDSLVLGNQLASSFMVLPIPLNLSIGCRVIEVVCSLPKGMEELWWPVKQFVEPYGHRVDGDVG
jgi:hypothetical protein